MNQLAILIGFEYNNKSLIPSTIIDLFVVNKYCEEHKIPTLILTDIVNAELPRGFSEVIVSGELDKEITEFLQSTQDNIIRITDKSTLVSTIIGNIKNVSHLLIYYSGHGEFDSIRLPSGDHMSFNTLKSIIVEESPDTSNVTVILDCCHPHMDLLYTYNNGYKLVSQDTKYIIDNTSKQHILCITAAANDQKSIGTQCGSVFTRKFIGRLREHKFGFGYLMKEITSDMSKYNQIMSIYSSHLVDPVIPSWLSCRYDISTRFGDIIHIKKLTVE